MDIQAVCLFGIYIFIHLNYNQHSCAYGLSYAITTSPVTDQEVHNSTWSSSHPAVQTSTTDTHITQDSTWKMNTSVDSLTQTSTPMIDTRDISTPDERTTDTSMAPLTVSVSDHVTRQWYSTSSTADETSSYWTSDSSMDGDSGEQNNNVALYKAVASAMIIIIILLSVFLCIMYKFDMDIISFLHILRQHFCDIIRCKYKIGDDSRDAESGRGTSNTLESLPPARQTTNGTPDSVRTGDMMIPTESMLDLSKIASLSDEEDSEEEQDDNAYNEGITSHSTTPVTVQQFIVQFGAKDIEKEQLRNEFETIGQWSRELTYPRLHAKLEKNRLKNRYYDIIPYDYNRVPLYEESSTKGLDHFRKMTPKARRKTAYINASYIREYGSKNLKYIAAQGPLGRTTYDFWEMVWQEDSDIIVMLTSLREQGKIKCEHYWPTKEEDAMHCRDIVVTLEVAQQYAYYDYRSITITKDGINRRVHHYQYHHWPDKEAPEMVLPILDLYRKVFSVERQTNGPIIVHCSAGVGRTGTFISLDYLQEQAKQTKMVDIMGCVYELRRQRVSMVQKVSQYAFLYEALHEALEVGPTVIPAAHFKEWFRETENDEDFIILKHFERMCEKKTITSPDDELCGIQAENINKNRDLTLIPDDRRRPFLFTFIKGRNSYINAVYVDTFLETDAVIVTQLPMESTLCDFWRLVYDRNCTTIILLADVTAEDDDCPIYWPDDDKELVFGDMMSIRGCVNKKQSTTNIIVRDYQVVMTQQAEYVISVKMFQLNSWPRAYSFPPNKRDVIDLIHIAKKSKRNATIVQCLNGCERSGIFCACLYIVDQIQMDHDIDVYHASRIVTSSRHEFIQTKEQYKFLHDFALEYLHMFDDYSNFADICAKKDGVSGPDSNRSTPIGIRRQNRVSSSSGDSRESVDSALARRIEMFRSNSDMKNLDGTPPNDTTGVIQTPSAHCSGTPDANKDIYTVMGEQSNTCKAPIENRNSKSGRPRKSMLNRVAHNATAGCRSSLRYEMVTPPKPCRPKSTIQ